MGNKKNNLGYYIYANGDRYEGEWLNDKKSGKLINKYTNHYKGFGKFTYNDNNENYEGSWLEDKKHGQGSYYFANGDVFIGNWD